MCLASAFGNGRNRRYWSTKVSFVECSYRSTCRSRRANRAAGGDDGARREFSWSIGGTGRLQYFVEAKVRGDSSFHGGAGLHDFLSHGYGDVARLGTAAACGLDLCARRANQTLGRGQAI